VFPGYLDGRAGRPVALDPTGKLLPWPMPDDTGYSYSAYFLSRRTIVRAQYNRRKLPYLYCCFDFDRSTFELVPEEHWADSTRLFARDGAGLLSSAFIPTPATRIRSNCSRISWTTSLIASP
jgi:hypothetical protein